MKPPLIEVLKIIRMKELAAKLYEQVDLKVSELHQQYGDGRFDYDLSEVAETQLTNRLQEKGQYLKFEIENNISKLQAGETVFKSASFKAVTFSSMSLKRCPDSLKPTE